MRTQKKAQGALEFLMTYGWAFMVILIMIGALAYFGVLSPAKFLPDRCQFGSPVVCKGEDYTLRADTAGTIVANLINNFGSAIIVNSTNITTDYPDFCNNPDICFDLDADNQCDATDIDLTGDEDADELRWEEGVTRRLVVDCPKGDSFSVGDKAKFIIKMKWYPTTSSVTFAKDVRGEIYANVQNP